ncbi:hypothetical protein M011DRAFT_464645 [Sporormia fimetaria CBS 119925]|uniref:Uncharacterized protein n=1 Tax=Sporormia fimetaria CBS 119925 TaxID=1340428 RepID=A0A6A6VJR5_9PLEO|nr:hypothetical protein M011DRAFT_464645 [Sporormia fimetaria CBS 119925]
MPPACCLSVCRSVCQLPARPLHAPGADAQHLAIQSTALSVQRGLVVSASTPLTDARMQIHPYPHVAQVPFDGNHPPPLCAAV